ncbi:hypothetical protein L3X07_00905 [Levilactobacillus brevis]|nr:hypothetical protein [Levilactobacillus brevis]
MSNGFAAYRTNDPASSSQKLNLGALYANPYREGMKRLRKREATPDKPRKWHWPWSK